MSKPFDKTKPFVVRTKTFNENFYAVPDRKARIICEDFKTIGYDANGLPEKQSVLLVAYETEYHGTKDIVENIMKFDQDGVSESGTYRLVNIPVKKTGWVNVFNHGKLSSEPQHDKPYCNMVYPSKEEAYNAVCSADDLRTMVRASECYIATVKIEWEE